MTHTTPIPSYNLTTITESNREHKGVYIYREREREKERCTVYVHVHVHVYVYVYIYIYIYSSSSSSSSTTTTTNTGEGFLRGGEDNHVRLLKRNHEMITGPSTSLKLVYAM